MSTGENRTRTESFDELSRRLGSGDAEACLVFIHGPHLGDLVPLDDRPVVLGRWEGCDLPMDGAGVSRTHCRIRRHPTEYVVEDLGSTNGTWVNDESVGAAPLRDGDLLSIGDSVLKFIGERNVEARYHAELHHQIARDPLTELYNRRSFEALLEAETLRAIRYGRSISLLVMDIDRFKAVNDTYGHLGGDAVLRQLAAVLRRRVRQGDSLFRTGGEELALILPETQILAAVAVAESYRSLVSETPFELDGTTLHLTVSVGAAEWREGMAQAEDLIAAADRCLYEAKQAGRNRVAPAAEECGSLGKLALT